MMRTQFSLKRKFDFGFVVLIILAITLFGAVRYLGKNALFFHYERNFRLLIADVRHDIEAIRYRSPTAQLVSSETLVEKFDQASEILRIGKSELTPPRSMGIPSKWIWCAI